MGFAFQVEVAIGAGTPDCTATAGAKLNQALAPQRVNVDPKCECALYRRAAASVSALPNASRGAPC
jgi:hypothetical protein